MNEQHLGSSCEGTCRDLSSASRTYFYCKMRRLDVVYELVLVMLQSTRNGVVQVGIHEWVEGQVSVSPAPPVVSFRAVDVPSVQLEGFQDIQ